jgi:hypothetical protein
VSEEKENPPVRTFLTRAYLVEVEEGVYVLHRNMEVMEKGARETTQRFPISPPLREARKGEEKAVKLRTVHPTTGRGIELVELEAK